MATLLQKKKPLSSHKKSASKSVQLEKPTGVGKIMEDLDKEIKKERKGLLPLKFKQKWIDALRSGKFKQITGDLATTINNESEKEEWGYCVLGVAAKVAGYSNEKFANDGEIPYELKRVPKILRQDQETGECTKIASDLIKMNDDKSVPFHKLADWIEKNL